MRIIDLDINEFLSGDTKIEEIALVMNPAIEVNWLYFNNQNKEITDLKFESYSDYPDAVSNNARKGIELNEKVNNKCATQVGKIRAQQLANKKAITVETIKRMYSYLSRAETYYDEGNSEACGTISYLLWGGLAAKRWSEAKLKELGLWDNFNHYDNDDDYEMVEGIIDILNKIDDIENRKEIAIDTIKEFADEGIKYDYNDFITRIGLFDELYNFNIEDTAELDQLLDEGYVITGYNEINHKHIEDEYRDKFNKEGITKEEFYKIVSKPKEPSILDSPFRLRRYVYAIGPAGGPDLIPTSRRFCREMMGKRQLVWRFEDIADLSVQLNAEDSDYKIIPRPKGANINCFLYAGGANCRHRWVELSLDPAETVYNNKEVMVDNSIISMDAPGQAGQVNEPVQYGRKRNASVLRDETTPTEFNKQEMLPVGFIQGLPVYSSVDEVKVKSQEMGCEGVYQEIEYRGEKAFTPCRRKNLSKFRSQHFDFKLDDEKRMIYSPVMIPNKLIPRMDEDYGKYYVRFTKEAIERAAYKFLMEKRVDKTNLEHSKTKFDDIFLVESWIVSDNDKIYDVGFTKEEVPQGSWAVGYKVMNDEVWEKYVKKGLVRGLSAEGLFDMNFNSHNMDDYLLDSIISIIKKVSD